MTTLSPQNPRFDLTLGETTVRYTRCPRSGIVEFSCFPSTLRGSLVPQREHLSGPHVDGLPTRWTPISAQPPEWLVQFKLAGSPEPGGHQVGRSLRGASEVSALTFTSQQAVISPQGAVTITTTLTHPDGYRLLHVLKWRPSQPFFQIYTEFHNDTEGPLTLEYLPSFSLGGITPFHPDDAPERLRLHRFRTTWSAEGRHENLLLEELSLERSWTNFSRRIERFGQIGSLPVRQFFPWAAVQDTAADVFWGVQLATPGSWHLEVGRAQDKVTLSGGLPSRDFGDWWKIVPAGSAFSTPPATLACVHGDLDDLCAALTAAQSPAAETQPAIERELPIVFNEWCSTWGEPTHDYVLATARLLARTRTHFLVIDDGWAEKASGKDIQFNGDWNVNRTRFPGGLKPTCDAVRALGLIPGLWFELEAATEGTTAFDRLHLHLRREGRTIQVGSRHFWDLRHPGTIAYLADKVIARLRDDGFGYLKIDYNDSLPSGVDGAESPGEGLRLQLEAVQAFIARIRRELPDLLIENCSSGGHRLEPSFQGLCAMGSFSDAHETTSIPIVAANLHRLILPRQSQIWCVAHASDSLQRLRYGLAATFLGRVCLSGELASLDAAQLTEIDAALDFYAAAVPVIRDGRSRLHLEARSASWNNPRGWQAVVRHTADTVLVVAHAFGNPTAVSPFVPLPPGIWRIHEFYGDASAFNLAEGGLRLDGMPAFSAAAALIMLNSSTTGALLDVVSGERLH